MAANQQLTTYLPRDLAERIDVAKREGKIDPKEIVKEALERALNPVIVASESELADGLYTPSMRQLDQLSEHLQREEILPLWAGQDGTPAEIAISLIDTLRSLVMDGPATINEPDDEPSLPEVRVETDTTFELHWAENSIAFQAKLDAITQAGGWPVSIAADSKDRIALLIAWPKE